MHPSTDGRKLDSQEPHSHSHDHADHGSGTIELYLAIGCGLAMVFGWLVQVGYPDLSIIWLTGYLVSYVLGGFFTAKGAFSGLLKWELEIDALMLIAALGAAFLGHWGEGSLLLFLFSMAHSLEHFAMGRARNAIESLAKLAPEVALVKRGGKTERLPVEKLIVGDLIVVKPGERIAADGFVVKGKSSVDQAPITGESIPVEKVPVDDIQNAVASGDHLDAKHRVFSGTINQGGALEVQVTRMAGETTLARVVKMVNDAKTKRSPTQRFTQKFENVFVPSVLGLVLVLMFAWVVIDEPFAKSFYRAMALLVGASPCALAISTPSAVLSGIARAARGGVLIKGGGPLEILGGVQAIAFDKTGTLTEGKPRLTDVLPFDSVQEQELLAVAIAIEQLSDHPLARAIVKDGMLRLNPANPVVAAEDAQNIVGIGLSATIANQQVFIGRAHAPQTEALKTRQTQNQDLKALPVSQLTMEQWQIVKQLESQGRTTMVVHQGDKFLGVLGVMDSPRPTAASVMSRLKHLGVEQLIMISGDNQRVADAVGQAVGIQQAWGDLMPEDKVRRIQQLKETKVVAMVGDGVNDAPAMANASVGIAMGAAGSDVALETADIALMADDLNHLPFAVGLSRKTRSIIKQNIWISLGMVAVLIPAAILGLQMAWAVMLHEGSTILVVLNALRLLAYSEQQEN